jgi:hypothetical protein
MELAVRRGKELGVAEESKASDKRIADALPKARRNGDVEVAAKARRIAAGTAMSTAGQGGEPPRTAPLTVEEAQTLPIEELIRRSKSA